MGNGSAWKAGIECERTWRDCGKRKVLVLVDANVVAVGKASLSCDSGWSFLFTLFQNFGVGLCLIKILKCCTANRFTANFGVG